MYADHAPGHLALLLGVPERPASLRRGDQQQTDLLLRLLGAPVPAAADPPPEDALALLRQVRLRGRGRLRAARLGRAADRRRRSDLLADEQAAGRAQGLGVPVRRQRRHLGQDDARPQHAGPDALRGAPVRRLLADAVHPGRVLGLLVRRHRRRLGRPGHLRAPALGPDRDRGAVGDGQSGCRLLLRLRVRSRHARHQHQHQLDRGEQRPRLPRAAVAQPPPRRRRHVSRRRLGYLPLEDPGERPEPDYVPLRLRGRAGPAPRHLGR